MFVQKFWAVLHETSLPHIQKYLARTGNLFSCPPLKNFYFFWVFYTFEGGEIFITGLCSDGTKAISGIPTNPNNSPQISWTKLAVCHVFSEHLFPPTGNILLKAHVINNPLKALQKWNLFWSSNSIFRVLVIRFMQLSNIWQFLWNLIN